MGSRFYVGHLDEHMVTFSYVHQGAYIDAAGFSLIDYFNNEEDAKRIAHTGGMHSISDGEVDKEHDKDNPASTVGLDWYEDFIAIDIESLYLFKGGEWHVKSCHVDGQFFNPKQWHLLKTVVSDLRFRRRPRQRMLEMMRDYRAKPVEFFCGRDVLDVEVISGLSRDVRGIVLTLTS